MKSGPLDLEMGRKLPNLIVQQGFELSDWRMDITFCNTPEKLNDEINLFHERFIGIKNFLTKFLGDEKAAAQYCDQYLETLKQPGTVYFRHKFTINAQKPGLKLVK